MAAKPKYASSNLAERFPYLIIHYKIGKWKYTTYILSCQLSAPIKHTPQTVASNKRYPGKTNPYK